MKRSKNIFNSPIVQESLMEEEGAREFKIGTLNIDSNWLTGVEPHEYRRYIVSALQLSVLQKELDDLREGEQAKQSNIFQIVRTKKKIDHLDLIEIDQQKPSNKALADNEPPQTQNLIIQKMTTGFFQSLLERKCKIEEKQLFIESQKDEKKWLPIGMEHYTLQLEQKQRALNRDEFKQFSWIRDYQHRILIWAPEKKPYCLYGQQSVIKKFQRYFQVQNIEVKQLNVFKLLDSQYQQKIITLFGNKLRFYDHNIKIRKAEKDAQLLAIQAIKGLQQQSSQNKQNFKQINPKEKSSEEHSSDLGRLSDTSQSGIIDPVKNSQQHSEKVQKSAISLDSSKNDLQFKRQKEKRSQSQVFKLKVKGSTVFYNQIQDPIEFDDKDGFSVADLKLNLRQQIGMSQVDEESESLSAFSNKLENKKKITKMTLENVLDQSQKFNIHIYQVNSNVNEDNSKQMSRSDHLSLSHKKSQESFDLEKNDQSIKRHNSLKISQISELRRIPNERKQSETDTITDYFQLDKLRPSEEHDGVDQGSSLEAQRIIPFRKAEKQNVSIRSFKKKKINEIEVFHNPRPAKTYFLISQIQMMLPYHSSQLHFQILQIDPELQMQNKLVVCGMTEGTLAQKIVNEQRYMFYNCQGGLSFSFSQDSNYFVFVLQEESKNHYLHFEVDSKPKYRKNCSQLLKTPLDKQGYPFAICLVMHVSPEPITFPEPLGTLKFMKKYLSEGQNYDFKSDFIDDKRRMHQVKKQWNKIHIKHAVLAGDSQAFAKSVFLGMSDSIFQQLKKKVTYNPNQLFAFTDNQVRMIEENVMGNFLDLKSFMKSSTIVLEVAKATYNTCMRERLQQVYVYFLNRYGSVRNLALIFIKAVLDKLQPILLLCRREEEVSGIINLYAQIEYQIDELFMKISQHFGK